METKLEYHITHGFKEQMVRYVKDHPEDFEELIDLAISDRQPYNWRGTWLMYSTMEENDFRVKNRIGQIIHCIPSKQPNHQRELMRVLLKMKLTDEQEGEVFDLAMNNWERLGLKPAIRYIAFRTIIKIARKYPELHEEVRLITQEHYLESLSSGIRNSINRMIRQLDEI